MPTVENEMHIIAINKYLANEPTIDNICEAKIDLNEAQIVNEECHPGFFPYFGLMINCRNLEVMLKNSGQQFAW